MSEQSIGDLASNIVRQLPEKMDKYRWWRNALAGNVGPIHENEVQAGFYRRKTKDGTMTGIAIWYDEGRAVAIVNGKSSDPNVAWVSGANRPVTEAAYREWESTGAWPDDHQIAAPPSTHNEPQDEAEILRDQIESARAGASDYATIEDDAQRDRAQSLRSRLLELSRVADKHREELKKPFLEGGKAIDSKWQPLIKAAKEVADAIARSMGAWETKKARAAEAAFRKAEEERRRREEEARAAEEAGKPVPPPTPAPEPVAVPPPTTQVRGAYGRAASVKVVRVVKRISDQDALYQHFKTEPPVVDALTKLAERAVANGHSVPGIETEEIRKVA